LSAFTAPRHTSPLGEAAALRRFIRELALHSTPAAAPTHHRCVEDGDGEAGADLFIDSCKRLPKGGAVSNYSDGVVDVSPA
jgi:hypothetical protein